ncbi:hypothetical protein BH24CHL1_BH24CHL1_00670 [soil metagenome]
MWRNQIIRVWLVVNRELVDDGRTGIVQSDNFNLGAITAELHDHLVQRRYRRDVPEMGAGYIDHDPFEYLLKIKRRRERVRRGEEDLAGFEVCALTAIV